MKKVVAGVGEQGEIPGKRQVQHFSFIEGYGDEGPETINFVLIDMIETLIVRYDSKAGKIVGHAAYRNTDSFMKILNPNVQPQVVHLRVYDEDDRAQRILQYFFLDAANQI